MSTGTGNGSSVTLPSGSGSITSITADAATVESIDTSHLGTTGARTFIASDLIDHGGFSVEGYWNGVRPAIGGAAGSVDVVIVTSSTGSTKTITGNGFVTSFEFGATMDELTSFSASIKWAGATTIA